MSSEQYILLVQAEVIPEYRQQVLDAAKINLPLTLAESGVDAFFQTATTEDPNKLVFFEVFASPEAHAFHLTQEYTKTFFATLEGKLVAPPVMTRLTRA